MTTKQANAHDLCLPKGKHLFPEPLDVCVCVQDTLHNCLHEKWLCRGAWRCHILFLGPVTSTYFQHFFHFGDEPSCLSDPVVFSMLWKDIFPHFSLFVCVCVSFLCHFPLPFLSWLDSISSKVSNGGGSGGIDFSITTLCIRLFWVVYMKHNWYPDFKAGVGVSSWEREKERERGQLMEKGRE